MKFIGMSAAVLLAISPVVTPILGVSSAVVYADSSYDAILRNALKSSIRLEGWNNLDGSSKTSLLDLVNSGAERDYYQGNTNADSNVFFKDLFKADIARGKNLKEILGAAGENSEAQFLVNGKSDVTLDDLSSSVLTLTVKVLGTDGKTAEADITLNTDAPEIALKEGTVVTAELSDAYLDFTVNPSRFIEVINGDFSASGWTISDAVSAPDMATVSPSKAGLGLNGEGVIDDGGFYVKAGPYTQLVTITLTNSTDDTLREKRTISITVNVGDDEADFLFLEKPLGNNSFPSGSTALNTTISGIDNRQDLAGKRFSDILIMIQK